LELIHLPAIDKPGIVLAPYGTLNKDALGTYDCIRAAYERAFPGSPVLLAFTSKLMARRLLEKEGVAVPEVPAALDRLHAEGSKRAILQSLQIVPGSEFHRAAALARFWQAGQKAFDRLALGLPLLASLDDCRRVSNLLPAFLSVSNGLDSGQGKKQIDSVVLVAHGTGHPADALYSQLSEVLRREHKDAINVFLGSIEGYPGLAEITEDLKSCKTKSVLLLPFLLVAGGHVNDDLAGKSGDSWLCTLTREGFIIRADLRGLGDRPEIVGLFIEHSRRAMEKM